MLIRVCILGFFTIPEILTANLPAYIHEWFPFAWVILFSVVGFLFFAVRIAAAVPLSPPSGFRVPWVGNHCRHCGNPY